MPYSARVLNANYLNAYTFPGGSMGATRAIMVEMDSEDELAALLGHETGHVNARHAAERAGKQMVAELAMVAGAVALSASDSGQQYVPLLQLGGQIGASALLAKYSRDNEREADSLGMDYMVKAGYNPDGMVGVMEMLRSESKHKPSLIETMFASHPMSEERYQTAVRAARTTFAESRNLPLNRERYMDTTARLRAIKGAIEEMQKGDKAMSQKNFSQAETHYQAALKQAPDDYAGLVSMAKCLLMQKKHAEGARYARRAQAVFPQEAQGHHLGGFADLNLKEFDGALQSFRTSQRLLPQNPNTIFFIGYSYEGLGRRPEAAREYQRFLQQVRQGQQAQHAARRLQEWGYTR
jgi:predicted Zn-dependent protease